MAYSAQRRIYVLPIHFDVDEHFLSLDTFVVTASQAGRILQSLKQSFFEQHSELSIIVLPPEEGSFLSKIAIYVGGPIGVAWAFINTDIGAAYFQGFTGKDPVEFASELGEAHGHIYEEALNSSIATENSDEERIEDITSDANDAICRREAAIIVEMTKGFLERETEQFLKAGISIEKYADAFEARNGFFEACLENSEVKAVGFSENSDFPLPRNTFPRRLVEVNRRKQPDDPVEWLVSVENIYVTSPNWDRDDQQSRHWKGKDSGQ